MNDPNIVPGTGWFQVGDWQAFLNRSLISLAIIIGGAILTGVETWATGLIREAPVPSDVITGLLAVNTWVSAQIRSIVFPTATKLKE